MMFSPQFLEEIRARNTLVKVVGRYVSLRKRGREYVGLCPFHQEETPSFHVPAGKDFYHCFGCGAHGDVVRFIMHMESLTFVDAVEKLATDSGMPMPEKTETATQRAKARHYNLLCQCCALACQFFQEQLYDRDGMHALSYIQKRNVQKSTCEKFRLGYAPVGKRLIEFLRQKGIDKEIMLETGLVSEGKNGPYSFFRDRLIFPVLDQRDRVIAFGGRHLGEAQAGIPKYINSRQSILFNKSCTLYNIRSAAIYAQKDSKNSIVVVEGYMDVISLTQSGFEGSVAPLGTSFSREHLQQLWRSVREPIVCFDGDDPGRKASMRIAQHVLPILKAGHSISIAFLPMGKDPDDLIEEQGVDSMRQILQNATSLFDFLWQREIHQRTIDTPEKLANVEERFLALSKKIVDRKVAENYRHGFNQRIWEQFKYRAKWRDQQDKKSSLSTTRELQNKNIYPSTKAFYRQQQIILAGLINYPDVFQRIEEKFIGFFKDKNLATIFSILQQSHMQGITDVTAICDRIKKKGYGAILETVLSGDVYVLAEGVRPENDPVHVESFLRHVLHLVKTGEDHKAYISSAKGMALEIDFQDRIAPLKDKVIAGRRRLFEESGDSEL